MWRWEDGFGFVLFLNGEVVGLFWVRLSWVGLFVLVWSCVVLWLVGLSLVG